MKSYAFKSITRQYHLSTVDVWIVRGEDPNTDPYDTNHHQPILGYYAGKLEDVIRYAVDLPGFWQTDRGGDFFSYDPPVIIKIDADLLKTRQDFMNEKAALEVKLEELIARFDVYEGKSNA